MSIIDGGHMVHAAILNFSKAFNKICHGKLISKLLGLKIDPCIIWWIVSFYGLVFSLGCRFIFLSSIKMKYLKLLAILVITKKLINALVGSK